MRRISLALALLGAVAAAGCGGAGGTNPPSSQNKGTPNTTYTVGVFGEKAFRVQKDTNNKPVLASDGSLTLDPVNGVTVVIPGGGVVTSADLACGEGATAIYGRCTAQVAYNATANYALAATATAPNTVWGWAGACTVEPCQFLVTANRYVAVRFAQTTAGLGAHPPFADPAVHVPEYQKQLQTPLPAGAYHCTDCHGSQGQGVGTAPSCGLCHANPITSQPQNGTVAKTGLVATVTGITLTSPITVSFTLKDSAGNGVDISNAATKNLPISNCGHGSSLPSQGCSNTTIGFALGYFSVGANSYNASGIVSPYTIYTKSSGSPTMLSPTMMGDNTTKGILTETATGSYTYKFPTTVVIDATKLANTHTLFMYATRQEDVSGGACAGPGPFTSCPVVAADNHKTYTAVNVIWNFNATTGAQDTTNKREIVNPAGCNKCHDGFAPKGLVSSAFHSGNKVDGRICNVCHNPARTSSPWANSAQAYHRIHAYAEEGQPAFVCVDANTPRWDPLAAVSANGTIYAGGGVEAVLPSSLTDASVCTSTNPAYAPYVVNDLKSGINPQIKAVAFDSTGLDLTYPQDIRNCDQCHGGAAQGAQAFSNASPIACNSCHANNFKYWYTSQAGIDGEMANGASFVPGFVAGDEAGNLQKAHPKLAVSPPDVQGCLLQNGIEPLNCNGNTNAAWLANAGQVPVGADAWTYDVSSVQLDTNGHPQIVFRMLKNGTAVPFDFCTKAAGSVAQTDQLVLFNNTYGGPSLYFAWAVPQDNIATPADFNGSASAFLPAVCSEGHTAFKGTSAATITGPDANQYYTVTLTYTANLTGAISMLTGGVGYTYNPSSTPPLTQTNVMGPFGVQYPVTVYNITGQAAAGTAKVYGASCTSSSPCATKTGGLIVPIKDAWMVGTGFTGRRVIVENARCDNCHARLGARPTFHVGQRNDAPTCSFCHKPNQGSGGWAANASTFIHAVHGTDKRTVNYTWEGSCNIGSTWTPKVQTVNPPTTYYANGDCIDNVTHLVVAPRFYYPEVTYPGTLSCGECHTPGFFAQTEAAAANLLWTTYAQGTSAYGNNPNTSPYVNPTTVYGAGFAFDPAFPNSTVQAAGTTLVGSPISAACFSCHDDQQDHMQRNGGAIYQPRSVMGSTTEACLSCHGTGQFLDVATVHP
jgi:OmcA/MtrC family decaheme c-type cytochrome